MYVYAIKEENVQPFLNLFKKDYFHENMLLEIFFKSPILSHKNSEK